MPAQKSLIIEQIPSLRRYARALMKNDVLAADDLVQDCLERALSRLHAWRQGSDLRAWLFTIMHNLYVNQVRRQNKGPQFVELPDQDLAPQTQAAGEASLELRDLQHGINELPPEQREILLLVSLEGLRYQQVATILGIPEGTVMSRLSRARKQLRNFLNHEADTPLRRVK